MGMNTHGKGTLPVPEHYAVIGDTFVRVYMCTLGSHGHWRYGYHVTPERTGPDVSSALVFTVQTYEQRYALLAGERLTDE